MKYTLIICSLLTIAACKKVAPTPCFTIDKGKVAKLNEEVQFNGRSVENVTLVPNYDAPTKPARKAKRWFLFN